MNNKIIQDFINKHKKKMEQPIVRSFLQSKYNYNLFEEAITNPTPENKQILDQTFKSHFKKIKVIDYVSKLIHYYSIDLQKKITLNKQRNVLNLDSTVATKDGDMISKYDIITLDNEDNTYDKFIQNEDNLQSHLSDELLIKSFRKLSKKQIKILNLFYLEEYTNKEIAKILGESEQTISYNHKSAIKKLKQSMQIEKERINNE
ncbi:MULTISPECIES: sigma-70 family RNA polymerase sigma factor [Bacillus cereus group]|uniref:sigma-70 family RNA polymerase sigma factor n=1 Tax=Bacillus cereus group TaxID=86661 RepID=UPI0007721318|nr:MULTISPECIES: sigma-70 family RNA polymerase sigma factor [Bacillus cereus group]KXI54493.1 RNA polymerase subunit sigma-70 [Bacillus cereus]MDA2769422.1 sigma-70 family RNA polymerase sigma factor [Bacillus cereus group sp. Bc010]MED1447676.1 sigma-70 family RNA polymerase sigma factor [Bacillus pacificus]